MVTIEEIQAAYYMVAATGVLIAVVFYIMNLRVQQENMKHTLETRKADILQRHAQMHTSPDFMRAWVDVTFLQNYKTYEEWQQKYGPTVNPQAYANNAVVIQYYEILGGLLKEGLVSIELIERIWHPIHLICVWERVEPLILGWRKRYKAESMYSNLEFLYNRLYERHPEMSVTRSVLHDDFMSTYGSVNRSQ